MRETFTTNSEKRDRSINSLNLAPGSPDMLDIEAMQDRGVEVAFDPQN